MTDPLGNVLDNARIEEECPLAELTVLSRPRDPYRVGGREDAHVDGRWFADALKQALTAGGRYRQSIHLRGIHYAAVELGLSKPNGSPYRNTDEDWTWLHDDAAKAGRWLGYADWDQVVDGRNDPPVIRLHEEDPKRPHSGVYTGRVTVGVPVDLTPRAAVAGLVSTQPFRLVFFGEKTSLEAELAPLADRFEADLFLPSGEASDSMVYALAKAIAGDECGRRAVILYLSDCDPAGWQMAVSVARKLQALGDLRFPDLDCELRPIALTPEQVRRFDLPHSPMKETELRADKWFKAFGVKQTEIDAIATLRPDLLEQIVLDALAPFYDGTLVRRTYEARARWQQVAQRGVDDRLGSYDLGKLIKRGQQLEAEANAINDELSKLEAFAGSLLPDPPEPPEPEVDGSDGNALFDTRREWVEQTRRLKRHKDYEPPADAEGERANEDGDT